MAKPKAAVSPSTEVSRLTQLEHRLNMMLANQKKIRSEIQSLRDDERHLKLNIDEVRRDMYELVRSMDNGPDNTNGIL